MRVSRVSYGLLSSFLGTLSVLRGWQRTEYPVELWTALAAGIAACALLACMRRVRGPALIAAAVLFGAVLAMHSVARTTHVTTARSIESFADDRSYTVRGFVVEAPDKRQMQTKLAVRSDTLRTSTGVTLSADGIVLATDRNGWPEARYGDEVRVTGDLRKPGMIEDFSYDDYLSLRGIYGVMPRVRVEIVRRFADRADANVIEKLLAGIYAVRDRFELQIARMQPEPHASLLTGLLTGSRGGMPQDLLDAFRVAGLSHIVAISGYNITIIITLVGGMLFWVPLKRRFPLLVIGITLFTVFVGASASVVRAAVMGILGLFALQTNRKADIRLLILWSAFFMLLFNPKQLWFDAGFQLSFLAVLGLAELSKPVGKALGWLPETLAIRESMTATMSAQIATLPLSMLVFKQLSVVAPLANLLVAPLIPLAMLFGFAGTALGFLWEPLGMPPSYVAWGILNMIMELAKLAASVPYAAVSW